MTIHTEEQLRAAVAEYRTNASELGHVEFKENYSDPEGIGRYISALSNDAALNDEPFGYLIWGVKDSDHTLVGTAFRASMKGKGNEDLIPWLTRLLDPQTHFEFQRLEFDSGVVAVVLMIAAAAHQPVMFKGEAYIRSGTYTKPLKGFPEHARRLWATFARTQFEHGIARNRLDEHALFRLIDHEAYFQLTDQATPDIREAILDALVAERLVRRDTGGLWQITNLGAVLFAKDLSVFSALGRKAPRVVTYSGIDKSAPAREQQGRKGYAVAFRGLIQYVRERVSAREEFVDGVRTEMGAFPEKAIRELIANALIHQDFTLPGTGPMVEIYSDRIEVTNGGAPLVRPDRLIDAAPQSRNEALAALMRRMGMCEERGSGWDQIAAMVESSELPAPLIEVDDGFMRVILFAHRSFKDLSTEERVRAVYFHACLQQVRRRRTTNASLRERFRVSDKNKASVSRLIRESLDADVIKPYDETVGAKAMSYVPYWAK